MGRHHELQIQDIIILISYLQAQFKIEAKMIYVTILPGKVYAKGQRTSYIPTW